MTQEFGLPLGLAQRIDYDGRIADLYRNQQAVDQAKQRAANRAKLFADDTRFSNAVNAFDYSQIRDYAQGKIKELGAWMRNNPGWELDPNKYSQYRSMTDELKDNPLLHKGLRVDSEIKKYEAYLNDPRNAPMRERPEVAQFKGQLANYIKTGSVDGVTGNNKEFQFIPPEQLTDITPTLMKYAKGTKQNGVDYKYHGPGTKSRHTFVTNQDKALAAQAAIEDFETGHIIKTNYNHYLSGLKEGEKPMTIKQFTIDKMEPFFDNDKYDQIHYQVPSGGGSGSGSGAGGQRDYFRELYQRGKQVPTVEVQAGANGTRERLLGRNGALNTNGSFIKTAKGDWIPFSGGIVPSDNITTSNSRFVYTPNKGGHLSYTATMPLDALEQAMDGANVFDLPTWGTAWLGNSTEIRDKYKDYGIQIIKGPKGEQLAQVDLWSPTEANNTNEHAAYNHGMGAKAEEISSAGAVDANTVTAPDGTTWEQGADGNLYGSNGMVYSKDGQRIK